MLPSLKKYLISLQKQKWQSGKTIIIRKNNKYGEMNFKINKLFNFSRQVLQLS